MSGGIVNLGMIGGFLHRKTPEIISEYLPIAKMLDGGAGLGGIMSKVMQAGGLQAIMSNPLGAITGQLQGTIAQGLSSLSGVAGVGSLVSSLTGPGGLASAVSNLSGVAGSLLSGQGVLAMVSHANIAGLAGAALPGGLGLDKVVAPLFADGMLSFVNSSIGDIVGDVVSQVSTVQDAVSLVQGFTNAANQVASGSLDALVAVGGDVLNVASSIASDVTAVHTVASIVATTQTPEMPENTPMLLAQALLRGLDDDAFVQMMASIKSHTEV